MYISRFASFWENAEPVTKVNLVREKIRIQAIGMAAPMASPWDIHFWYFLYPLLLMSAHERWNQTLQLSQATPEQSQLTSDWQYPQGKMLACPGPGLSSMFPLNNSIKYMIQKRDCLQSRGTTLRLIDLYGMSNGQTIGLRVARSVVLLTTARRYCSSSVVIKEF